jgi:hypothetical protein
MSLADDSNLFVSLGSKIFLNSNALEVLLFETAGTGPTTINWGGQTAWAGTEYEFVRGRIAQSGINFDNLIGSSQSSILLGDYNANGVLDAFDIDELSAAMRSNHSDVKFDLNLERKVDASDRSHWINQLMRSFEGDANLDREFNSGDLVTVFVAGKYESGRVAGWADGDWNGDARFDSSDFVSAFSAGGYEQGPRRAISTVPEATPLVMWIIVMIVLKRAASDALRGNRFA